MDIGHSHPCRDDWCSWSVAAAKTHSPATFPRRIRQDPGSASLPRPLVLSSITTRRCPAEPLAHVVVLNLAHRPFVSPFLHLPSQCLRPLQTATRLIPRPLAPFDSSSPSVRTILLRGTTMPFERPSGTSLRSTPRRAPRMISSAHGRTGNVRGQSRSASRSCRGFRPAF